MPWGRLHDGANGDAKLLALSDGAWRLWGTGLIYCQKNLTDGQIPAHALVTFGVRLKPLRRAIDELCAVLVPGKKPLWHRPGHGQAAALPDYQMNDYLDWNDAREDVLQQRRRTSDRVGRFRQRLAHSQTGVHVTPLQPALQTALPNASNERYETRSERSSEQGSTTTTKDQTQEDQHRSRGAAFEPDDSWPVLQKLAHTVLDDAAAGHLAEADVTEELKRRAARASLRYDSTRVRKVLDACHVQRRLAAAGGRS